MTRRFRRRPSVRLLFAATLCLILLARHGWDQFNRQSQPRTTQLVEGPCSIVRVVDGDTLLVRQTASADQRAVRLRLLGIDCPEAAHSDQAREAWSAEATKFTRDFVSRGTARLRLDRRRLDRYDRFLAYVFFGDRMLNLELVRAGLARVQSYPGDSPSLTRQLLGAEDEARTARRGIWSQ